MDDFLTQWVTPYYLKILHGNYVRIQGKERATFHADVQHALQTIDAYVVKHLLSGGWREQITGSWFCGLKGWSEFAGQIGEALITSKVGYAGQGFCFALACFADDTSVKYLMRYLDIYLPQTALQYDQQWAMPALIWVDMQRNTTYSAHYLVEGGLWDTFSANKISSLNICKKRFWEAMEYCLQYFKQ